MVVFSFNVVINFLDLFQVNGTDLCLMGSIWVGIW